MGREAKLPSFPKAPTAPGQTCTVFTPSTAYMGHQGVAACRCGLKSLCSGVPTLSLGCVLGSSPHVHSGAGKDHHVCVDVQMLILVFSLSLPFSHFWFHLGGFTITGMDFYSSPVPLFLSLHGHILIPLFPLGFLFAFVLSWRETLEW